MYDFIFLRLGCSFLFVCLVADVLLVDKIFFFFLNSKLCVISVDSVVSAGIRQWILN